jgi:hypothetical protein
MNVLVGVRVLVVDPVVRDPPQQRPLDRHRPEDGQCQLERPGRLERAVREEPVKSDRNPEAGQEVHRREDGQLRTVNAPSPEQDDGGDEATQGENDGSQVDEAK